MNAPSSQLIDDIVATAESLLSQRFGGTQKFISVQELNGSGNAVVLRAKLDPSPFVQQRSVVLKYTPESGELTERANLIREIVAYQFTTSLGEEFRPGPTLLAHDINKNLLVITDIGDGDNFAEILMSSDHKGRINLLRTLGRAIGRMHTGTASKEQDYEILLGRMFSRHPEIKDVHSRRERMIVASIQIGESLIRAAGIDIPPEVHAFANRAARRLKASHHRAFTPFDLAPENIIVSKGTNFLDYEWAGFHDAFVDVASVVAGFPQNLATKPLSNNEVDVFIESWVHEVSGMWPMVRDKNEVQDRVVSALIGWSFSSVALMYFGVDDETFVRLSEQQVDFGTMSDEFIKELIETSAPWAIELLSTMHVHPSDDLRLIRKDLYHTFESLERYATRCPESGCQVVAEFARAVAQRLDFRDR